MATSEDGDRWPPEDLRGHVPRWLRRFVHHPLTSLASKSAVAAGLAFWLGGFMPGQVSRYRYYAALGAFSVIYPALADSLRESARALSAIVAGVAVAVAVQLAAWTNPVTVALAVGVGVALGGVRWFRDQRSWIPVAALFVLTVGGSDPEVYVLGYITQLLLGAVVGLAANYALFAPLPVYELEASAVALRRELVTQLGSVADALERDDQRAADAALIALPQLTPARDRSRRSVAEARRARRGNPRARRATSVHRALFDLSESLERCSASVEAVGVVMLERDDREALGAEIRAATVRVLRDLALVLDSPEDVGPGAAAVRRAERGIVALLDEVDRQDFAHRESRYVAGAAAVSASRCLDAFVTAYRRSGPAAADSSLGS